MTTLNRAQAKRLREIKVALKKLANSEDVSIEVGQELYGLQSDIDFVLAEDKNPEQES